MNEIKVGFADDHRLFRLGFANVLKSFSNINLVIEAESGADLLEQIKQKGLPDVVLLDLDMPGTDGIQTARMLKEQYPAVKTIILTGHDDEELIIRLLQDGFHAYLHKDAHESEVARAIYEVAEKGTYISKKADQARQSLQEVSAISKRPAIKQESLSAGEIEIIKLICKGLKNEQIADVLHKSLRTIQNQRLALRRKINARSTAEIINYAIKNKLIEGTDFYDFRKGF